MPHQVAHVVLDNGSFRCIFDPSQAALISLSDAAESRDILQIDHIKGPLPPLFRLNWDAPTQEPRRSQRSVRHVAADAELHLVDLTRTEVGERIEACTAVYEVSVPADAPEEAHRATVELNLRLTGPDEIQLSLAVSNHSTRTISEVVYPVICGVQVAADPNDEALLYPFYSGARIKAPRRALLEGRTDPPKAAPLSPVYFADGSALVRHPYCGQLSMSWMAIDGPGHGVALLHYDRDFEVSALSVFAQATDSADDGHDALPAGLDLAVTKVRPIEPGETRQIAPTGVLMYSGTWHAASQRYQQWIRPLLMSPRVPDWVRESHALTAHYDFKWEDGTFTHTFRDIPDLYRRTAQEGITHLFMAGWFTGGFDHMYPEYYPDLQLGTVMDFIDAVRTVRSSGGKCTFYINGSLFGKASRFYDTLGTDWAVKDPAGRMVERTFFGRDFTVSCRGTEGYRRHMKDTARWLVGEVGASGVYIDTFAAIGPHLCFDPSHGHPHPAHWNRDSIAALRQIEDGIRQANSDAFTMIEGCADLYGQWVVGHLIQAWYYMNSFPEMFRYTFPEYVLVDMVYPSKGQSFRPQRISDEAHDQLHRTWVNGCILWIYDQEDDRFCNFRSDPELWAYIKKLLALRETGKAHFAYGVFHDALGLIADDDQLVIKRYVAPPEASDKVRGEMLAVWNRTGEPAAFVVSRAVMDAWRASEEAPRLRGMTVDGEEFTPQVRQVEEGLEIAVPGTAASLIFTMME